MILPMEVTARPIANNETSLRFTCPFCCQKVGWAFAKYTLKPIEVFCRWRQNDDMEVGCQTHLFSIVDL